MGSLSTRERATLPARAFAYIDSQGRRRLPIHDAAHVRNALARFERVAFEDDAARERARRRLLEAATRFGVLPVGFIDRQLRSERTKHAPDHSALPTGQVTFLMTDIEGSTTHLRRLEKRYAEVLQAVRAVVRGAVRRHGGHQVDAHGDEVLAAFERPAAALAAAVDVQRTLGERAWPGGVPVRVRAGIHGGRPTLTETGYVGLAVHTVARVCAAGHGGQVLLSGASRAAARAGATRGLTLQRLGEFQLAGLEKPTPLYQVKAAGLAERFPPPRGVQGPAKRR